MPVVANGPVAERIAGEIEHRLQRLLLGTSSPIRVREIVRPKRNESNTPIHLQIVLTQGDPEVDEALSHAGYPPATCWKQWFSIRCHLMPSELDPTPVDTYQNYLVADIRRAVCKDASWWTFDGLAINSQWDNVIGSDMDGGLAAFNMPLIVWYRTDETDPYTLRA